MPSLIGTGSHGLRTAQDVWMQVVERNLADRQKADNQAAQAPVLTGCAALPRAPRTTESGTPKPVCRVVPTLAAKTVAITRPAASTTGPPELPERTTPRNDVISRLTGPRP